MGVGWVPAKVILPGRQCRGWYPTVRFFRVDTGHFALIAAVCPLKTVFAAARHNYQQFTVLVPTLVAGAS